MNARPTAGFRIVLTLAASEAEGASAYRGFVHLPDRDVELTVGIARPSGVVSVQPSNASHAPEDVLKQVAALVRAATKAQVAAGAPLPRTITRWRG